MKQKINVEKLNELINSEMVESYAKMYPINYSFRSRELTIARFVVFEFLYANGMTYHRIGQIFSKSSRKGTPLNHATVINGIKKAKDFFKMPRQNKDFIQMHEELTPLLNECLFWVGDEYEDQENIEEIYPELVFSELELQILNCKKYTDFVDLKKKIVDNRKKLVKLDLD